MGRVPKAFCRRTMEEVGEYLDVLLIRPIIDGKRIPEVLREEVGHAEPK